MSLFLYLKASSSPGCSCYDEGDAAGALFRATAVAWLRMALTIRKTLLNGHLASVPEALLMHHRRSAAFECLIAFATETGTPAEVFVPSRWFLLASLMSC